MTENQAFDRPTIGIIGAGTMGSGIALAALYAGFPVILQDIAEPVLERARAYLEKFLARRDQADRISFAIITSDFDALATADIVIEAALEDLKIKGNIFRQLEAICRPDAILTTNTSTLSVTAIASHVETPQRVAGLHFFNPAPVLPLVEVVRGVKTSPEVIEALLQLAESLGKTAVVVTDTPGFIVNRVARPFYGEALRLLGEGTASHETIDMVVQMGGGFRMGPFRLMDLIGIDINALAMQSMYEQTFNEPRYRPHHIQMQKMASKTLGYKTGMGFYDYTENATRQEMPAPPEAREEAGTLWASPGTFAPGMVELLEQSGYVLIQHPIPEMAPLAGFVFAGKGEGLQSYVTEMDSALPPDVPIFCQCADTSIGEVAGWLEYPETLVGFDGLFFCNGPVATLVGTPFLAAHVRTAAENFVRGLGKIPVWIPESPGLLLPRIVCMLVNEAAFAVMEGVAEGDVIDTAMRLGVNYPEGPLAWGEKLGFSQVVQVIDHLYEEYREDRYRACVLLRRWARNQKTRLRPSFNEET